MQLFNSLYHNSNKVFNMAIMLLLLFVVVSTFSLPSLDGNQTDSNIGVIKIKLIFLQKKFLFKG
ncbi:unnamed protein product [Meloidogyne enterolobii]|uniref:Uncharacterized protein n=1 Tax=Meloidogyne enterolobii TaxID=390850 RepID=A0ACB1AJC6_MELEN